MKEYKNIIISVLFLLFMVACQDEVKKEGPIGKYLKNDCLLHTLGGHYVVGGPPIEFVYAMALPRDEGRLLSASVEATFAGANPDVSTGTFLENRSARANASGADQFFTIGSPAETSGAITRVTFTADTCAAALRYWYQIPPEAKGKEVSFTFSSAASNGESVSYPMGPY